MKRDMALVRKILLWRRDRVERITAPIPVETVAADHWFNGISAETLGYHVEIMADAGLIEYIDGRTSDSAYEDHWLGHITWEGHDFLDAIEKESIFNQVMSKIAEKGLGTSFEIVKALAIDLVKREVGLG